MIDRIYIDNYRCFTDFEFSPAQFELFLGPNGSGKTTILDVLFTLRDFITTGEEAKIAFPAQTRTAWDPRQTQTFEIGLEGNGGHYLYNLVIEHDSDGKSNRVQSESLVFNETYLYRFAGDMGQLHFDDDTPAADLPVGSSRSAIYAIPKRSQTRLLTWFRERMEKIYIFSPDPLRMTSLSKEELEKPDRCMHDFASWLRHVSQENMGAIPALVESLREVFDGFKNLRLEKSGNARELNFDFDFPAEPDEPAGAPYSLLFDQLSEGQRNLTVLSAIINVLVQSDTTVCIDEPDNYVALAEIQPLLTLLTDKVEDESSQCFLISHNAEVMNYLAAHHGTWFYRQDGGPTRVKRFEYEGDDPMTPAEIFARGLA